MSEQITKRGFILSTIGAAGAATLPARKTESSSDWDVMSVHTSEAAFEAIDRAQKLAKETGKEIIFVFNYSDHFRVLPSGKWTCKNQYGIKPVCGPDSEFVPEKGWGDYYGH